MEYVTLNNGAAMPMLGYGCFLVSPGECERCVIDAIEVGYRTIDTAQAYYNEGGVDSAISKTVTADKMRREELFIATRVWIMSARYEKARVSTNESLRKLQVGYTDLLLVHQAFNDYHGTWRAIEGAHGDGKVKAISANNFYPDRFVGLALFSEVKPIINQLETYVFQQHKSDRRFIEEYGVKVETWAPFIRGEKSIFIDPVLTSVGQKYGKTTGQVTLRLLIQNSTPVVPKPAHKERMAGNLDIFDLQLNAEEIGQIKALDQDVNLFMNHEGTAQIEGFLARFGMK